MHHLLKFIVIVLLSIATETLSAQAPATASTTAGWRRIAYADLENGRGFGKVSIWILGGSFAPAYTDVHWFKDWAGTGGLSVSTNSKSVYWSEFRLKVDGNMAYIEANFNVDLSGLRIVSDPYGWNVAKVYTGVLPSAETGTVLATAKNSRFSIEDHLIVAFDGNIGVNTSSPTEKLSVNGKIRASEIKVEAGPWPDYVFEKDYKLKPLAEVEQFIKANKHLPEVPSAKELEADGLSLGEMNRLMMKKIEELTLHLIEKDKALEQLNNKVSVIDAELRRIKNQNTL